MITFVSTQLNIIMMQLDSSVEDDKSSVVERSGEKNCFPEGLHIIFSSFLHSC